MNEPIIVKQSLKGNILYVFGALLMCVLSLLFVFMDLRVSEGILKVITQNDILYIILKIIFVIGFLFFGYCFFFLLKRAKAQKDILIVDEKGITDNSSALAFGFIPWSDVEKIYIDSVMGNYFIEIVLKNEENYLQRLKGVKKLLVLANKNMGHQLVCITLNSTGVSPDKLLPKILEKFEQFKVG